ncbi:MAG TPA: response regulator, partial [Chitinophagaceae bacterium]|nr:response regulator [Chitinophagaceae bacterium]
MIRALIIDDEKHCIDNLQWQLKQYCPEIEVSAVCKDAKEALYQIHLLQPQLIFLDVEMPGMNGFEMLEK